MRAVIAGLHFDRRYLSFFDNQEIDLHVVFTTDIIIPRVEVEFVTVAAEHLRHNIFHDHALVNIKLIKEYGFI